ncbi:hypothetical protein NJ76_31380 [Rhodococcus sp. IITR03]|nr:hypothetical protein NJ76_31380 [Rhodococcus sp. IITR03]
MASDRGVRQNRRVVTGHNDAGRSIVISDGPTPNVWTSPDVPGLSAIVAWRTHPGEVRHEGDCDEAPSDVVIGFPETGGTVLRIATFPPDSDYSPEAIEKLFGSFPSGDSQDSEGNARHFWFHRTESLDYAIVLSGEISLLTDEDESRLGPGDVVIQRATNHAWANRGDEPAQVAFVLIGTPPLDLGSGAR